MTTTSDEVKLTRTEEEITHIILTLKDIYNPKMSVTKEMLITHHYKHGVFTTKTVQNTINTILKEITSDMLRKGKYDTIMMLKLYRQVVIIYNEIYNRVIHHAVKDIVSVSMTDYMDIQLDPKLMKAIENVAKKQDVKSIQDAYKIVEYILAEDKNHLHNAIAMAYKAGIISDRQTKQMFGPRGFVSELGGKIFKYPIPESFTLGLNDLYSFTTESRSAAKALFQSTKAIQDSEYFSRRLQLLTSVVEQIVYTDCGNEELISWYVKPKEFYNGDVTYNGDIPGLVGKHYKLDPKDKEWKFIKGDEDHLYNKTIHIRSVEGCKLDDPHSVCVKCFGDIGYNVPKDSNIGILSATMLMAIITQMILSTKHFTGSASTGNITLDDTGRKFLTPKKKGFGLKPGVANRKVKLELILEANQGYGIKDINANINFIDIDPARITRIQFITIRREVDGKVEMYEIPIKQQNRHGYFSVRFLQHIVEQGVIVDDYGNYVIDLTKWKQTGVFIHIPDEEFSFSDFGEELKNLITVRKFTSTGETKDSYRSLLSQVFTMITTKLHFPLSYVEVILYALTTYDMKNGNYKLGRKTETPGISNLANVVNSRSMGIGFNHDDLKQKLINPISFTTNSSTDSVLDAVVTPQEAIDTFKRRNRY